MVRHCRQGKDLSQLNVKRIRIISISMIQIILQYFLYYSYVAKILPVPVMYQFSFLFISFNCIFWFKLIGLYELALLNDVRYVKLNAMQSTFGLCFNPGGIVLSQYWSLSTSTVSWNKRFIWIGALKLCSICEIEKCNIIVGFIRIIAP